MPKTPMGNRYKIRDQTGIYFITSTVSAWMDLFIRREYKDCLLDSFRYCVENKGLNLHAYVIMSSHFHAIVSAKENHNLSNIIRDLKKFTAKELIRLIKEIPESRRVWLLNRFAFEANKT